ncbi:MAG TPA: caspase family protein [Pyrinomonadaceae bacterium]|nr:caspase family protein [Pyrinomonadaceae bacterium]
MLLVLFITLTVFAFDPFAPVRSEGPPLVFELELPDFQLSSTQSEITIPSSSVSRVLINVLNPAADSIDYGAIKTSINGIASATIAEVVAGVRGKIVKLDLQRLPGFQFANGRNTVEVWAENRRGRDYYTSFIIKTATENWNDDATYKFFPSPNAKNEVPPKVVLIEPARAVELSPGTDSATVSIKGIASATTTNIVRVSVDGRDLALKAVPKTKTRELTRLSVTETNMAFETTIQVNTNTSQIVIEAEDKLGSRTQVFVPVLSENRSPRPVLGRKYALIIGVSRYQNNGSGIKNLEFADADARALYEFLQKSEAGKFSRDNMLLLANEDATTARIREALTSFVSRAEANDVLLIFFAGHGAADPNAPRSYYLITHDTIYEDMSQTAISMTELRRYVDSNVKSKQLIFLLDACHSAGVSTRGVRSLDNNLAHLRLRKLYEAKGRAIITSSDVDEVSNESVEWGNGHGVFTYYLLEGLKGDADENRDRLVTLGELFRYVSHKVQDATARKQTPQKMIDNEDLALAIAYQP